jgi:hypothetical protein
MATCMQDSFSGKAVGQSAPGSAITAGVDAVAQGVGSLKPLADASSWRAAAGRDEPRQRCGQRR